MTAPTSALETGKEISGLWDDLKAIAGAERLRAS
jgi:hypothetical protein